MNQPVSVGRIVRYREWGGKIYAAIVTEVDEAAERVSLTVFPPGIAPGAGMTFYRLDVSYAPADSGIQNSWHWPERV